MKSARSMRKRMSIVNLPSQNGSPMVSSRRGLVKNKHGGSLFEANASIKDSGTSSQNVSHLSRSVLRRKSFLQNQESGTSSNKTRFVRQNMKLKVSARIPRRSPMRRKDTSFIRTNTTDDFIVPARFNDALKKQIKDQMQNSKRKEPTAS